MVAGWHQRGCEKEATYHQETLLSVHCGCHLGGYPEEKELKSQKFEMQPGKLHSGKFLFVVLTFVNLCFQIVCWYFRSCWIEIYSVILHSGLCWFLMSSGLILCWAVKLRKESRKRRTRRRQRRLKWRQKAQKAGGKGNMPKAGAAKGPKLGGGGGKRWASSFVVLFPQI